MNRRGFLGSVAGAFVGGAFQRLAPAPPPPVPAAVAELDFWTLVEAEMKAAMDRMALRMAEKAYGPPPPLALLAVERDPIDWPGYEGVSRKIIGVDWGSGDYTAEALLEIDPDGRLRILSTRRRD